MMSIRRSRGFFAAAAGGAALALTLAACTAPPEDDGGTTGGDGEDDAMEEGCEGFEDYGDLSGTTVTVYTSITAPEEIGRASCRERV